MLLLYMTWRLEHNHSDFFYRCSDRFLFIYVIKMKRKKKTYCGGTVSKFFKKRRKRQNDRAHSWHDTGASIKSGRFELVLCAQINLFYKFNLQL